MAYKTILTVIGIERGMEDLDLAAELCGETGAHLSVLIMAFAVPPPMGNVGVFGDVWVDERESDLKRLEKRSAELTSFVADIGLSADVTTQYPDSAAADEVIGRRARYADTVFVGPEMLANNTLKSKVIEGTLFWSGRPLLLAPQGARPTLKPKRVLVAWDSSMEASRAVRESLDMLVAAEAVRVVLVDPLAGELDQGAEPGADVAAFLARHDVKVTVDRLPSSGHSIAQVLSRHAVDSAADLLVMGAYGHSRLRELLFGGVTKAMLGEPPSLVLMAR